MILLTVALLMIGVNAVVLRPEPPSALAARFVPGDGSVAYRQIATNRAGRATTENVVVESGRFVGLNGILSVDSTLSARVLAAIDEDTYQTVRLWRTTSTITRAPTVGRDEQATALYRVDGAAELLGSTSTSESVVYVPALTVLPADVASGSRWQSAGSAGDQLDYTAEFTAESAVPGCLTTQGTIRYTDRINQGPAQSKAVEATWCVGRGMVAATESSDQLSRTMTTLSAPSVGEPSTESTSEAAPADGRWTARPISVTSDNPQFGPGV